MRKIHCLLLVFLFSLPAVGQKPSVQSFAFLRVTHYSPMPYMMPDYFQEEAWTDSIMGVSAAWLKKTLKVQKVDYKMHESITYQPTHLPEEAGSHNFSQTDYTYFTELQTELTLGYHKKQLPELDKGVFALHLKVFDQNQRKVLQKSLKIPFIVQSNKDGLGDVWLTSKQFKQLYEQALKTLTQGEKAGKNTRIFEQTSSDELTTWLQNATKTTLIAEGRGKYMWVRGDSTLALALELQLPYYAEKTYRREATFTYAGQAGKMQLKGLLAERNPKELFIQFITPQLNLAALQTHEVLDLSQTEAKKNAWTWIAYNHNGMVKVYEGDVLKAVLVRNTGYDCYLASRWTIREAAMISKMLMADVLVRALQKQYDVR